MSRIHGSPAANGVEARFHAQGPHSGALRTHQGAGNGDPQAPSTRDPRRPPALNPEGSGTAGHQGTGEGARRELGALAGSERPWIPRRCWDEKQSTWPLGQSGASAPEEPGVQGRGSGGGVSRRPQSSPHGPCSAHTSPGAPGQEALAVGGGRPWRGPRAWPAPQLLREGAAGGPVPLGSVRVPARSAWPPSGQSPHSLWWLPRPAHRGQPSSEPSSPEVSRPRPALRLASGFPKPLSSCLDQARAGGSGWPALLGAQGREHGGLWEEWPLLVQGTSSWAHTGRCPLASRDHTPHTHTHVPVHIHIHTRTHLHTAPACPQHSTESGVFPQLPGGKIKASHFLLSSK